MIVGLSYIAALVGTIGQWADGFTTWTAVKKFGPSVEGNKSWFAQFQAKHPSTLLYLKAFLFAIGESAVIYAGPHTNYGGNAIAILGGVAGAIMGFVYAWSNYKVIKGQKG